MCTCYLNTRVTVNCAMVQGLIWPIYISRAMVCVGSHEKPVDRKLQGICLSSCRLSLSQCHDCMQDCNML